VPVDRTGFITASMRRVASGRDEVPQSEAVITAPLKNTACRHWVPLVDGAVKKSPSIS
jgi:hypothetical protein